MPKKIETRTWDSQGREYNYGLDDRQLDARCRELCALRGYSYREALEEVHRDFYRAAYEREEDKALEREQRERRIEETRRGTTPEEQLEAMANDIVKSGRNNFDRKDVPHVFSMLADAYDRHHGDLDELWELVKTNKYEYTKIVKELKQI